jgi:hypothetical protein
MPSKKRVHLQQSGIISLANPRSNLHQESWEKQVDLPNYWDNHKLCKWVGKSYKKIVLHRDNHKSMSFEMQNHTHTQITVIIDTLEQGYNAAISSWRDMQNHTHTDYSHHWYIRTRLQCGHIFMTRYAKSHTHIDLAGRSSILLAGHRSCSTWSLNKLHLCWWLKQWSLDTGWNFSSWCQEVLDWSRSREEGSKCLALLYQKKELYTS